MPCCVSQMCYRLLPTGRTPVLPSRRPLLAEAVQPCLAALRAAAAWLQAPSRSFPGAAARAGQWPAGVAHGWATAISDMTEVAPGLRRTASRFVVCSTASIMTQQCHMRVMTCVVCGGPHEGLGCCNVLTGFRECECAGQVSAVRVYLSYTCWAMPRKCGAGGRRRRRERWRGCDRC